MGLTRIRADQISDIDYKQAVRAISLDNVTLSLGAPSQVDGVNLNQGDRILVAGQSTATQNGIYRVDALGTGSNGTWVRANDANATGEIEAGMIVMVTEGTIWADTSWKLTTNNPIAIGGTALTFVQNTGDSYSTIIANGVSIFANAVSSAITFSNGNNLVITGNATTDTVTFSVSDAPVFTGNITAGNLLTTGTANVNSITFTNTGVRIGLGAGSINQGANSIAIGVNAGAVNQPGNTIVINATGVPLNPAGSGLFVNPVRGDSANTGNAVYFNPATYELTYAVASPYIIWDNGGSMGLVTEPVTTTQDLGLVTSLPTEFYNLGVVVSDGGSGLTVLTSYTIATLPAASTAGAVVYVTNAAGGAVPAFADGLNWYSLVDRTLIA